jgi:hypothetical protein
LRWKQFLKAVGYTLAPQLTTAVVSSRSRAHSASLVKAWGLFDLNQRLIARAGRRVLNGPFAGMTLTSSAEQQHVGPYLLGTYEMELHGWIEQCLRGRFNQIVDIGTSFGYYAVGLARSFPRTPVIAFDPDWWARRAVAEMAAANGVSNITLERYCTSSWLARNLKSSALVVSDCEGYEATLFLDAPIPTLATATMIVELHEQTPGELAQRFEARFSPTHSIERVSERKMTPVVPTLSGFDSTQLERLSREVRGPQTWVYLRPVGTPCHTDRGGNARNGGFFADLTP